MIKERYKPEKILTKKSSKVIILTDKFIPFRKDDSLVEEMNKDNCKYKEKIEKGKRVAGIIYDGTVFEGSLSNKNNEAFHLYIKQNLAWILPMPIYAPGKQISWIK